MEKHQAASLNTTSPDRISSENSLHHETRNSNNVSKGWPPPTKRVQRSASIR